MNIYMNVKYTYSTLVCPLTRKTTKSEGLNQPAHLRSLVKNVFAGLPVYIRCRAKPHDQTTNVQAGPDPSCHSGLNMPVPMRLM